MAATSTCVKRVVAVALTEPLLTIVSVPAPARMPVPLAGARYSQLRIYVGANTVTAASTGRGMWAMGSGTSSRAPSRAQGRGARWG